MESFKKLFFFLFSFSFFLGGEGKWWQMRGAFVTIVFF